MKPDRIGGTPVVDFDYFTFKGHGFNHEVAKELATILIDESSIDELKGIYDENERWNSAVGTGGTGSNFVCPSQGSQRASLASHFASYANRKYQSCYLSLYEYKCLQELLQSLEEDYFITPHREKIYNETIALLTKVCSQFEKAYARENPEFLFTLLKK